MWLNNSCKAESLKHLSFLKGNTMLAIHELIVGSSVDIEHDGNIYKVHAETLFHLIIRKVGEREQYIYSVNGRNVRPGKNTKWTNKNDQASELLKVGAKASGLLLSR
ncbi:gp92 [Corynebacterium phage P1201]|uniref:Gp92 n=1 Tax=Corynebacterium phage P1201 TaxID=384848 RepID=A7IYF9_9CAUD|nr:gp92 [Corynebacterium phage P1201]ABF57542.1 gp92 [Corynebacterium phage P1201]